MYFSQFVSMLKRDTEEKALAFDFGARNRRPAADPVNALPSFSYALLVRVWGEPAEGTAPSAGSPARTIHAASRCALGPVIAPLNPKGDIPALGEQPHTMP